MVARSFLTNTVIRLFGCLPKTSQTIKLTTSAFLSSLLDVRVKKSADVGSDHHLLVASMRLKIAAIHKILEKVGKK